MVDKGNLKVEKFRGKNFQLWKMKIEDYLYQKDLWNLLEGKSKKQGTMVDEEWEISDRKALGRIQLCLAPLITFNITKAKTMKELMQTLTKLNENPST